MKKYKLLVSDYDGTLASSDGIISKENIESINSFINRGGIFVVCSGRATDSIKPLLKRQGFKGMVASFNGAEFVDIDSGKTLYSKGIPYSVASRFFEYTTKNKISAHFYGFGGFYYAFHNEYIDRYTHLTGVKGTLEENLVEKIIKTKKATPKLLIFDDKEKLDLHYEKIKALFTECDVFRSTDNMIDLNLKGANKGGAIESISSYFNLTSSDVLAVGDAGNDEPMLLKAGFPIAVCNAEEHIKKLSKAVAPKNTEHAIKYIIEKYCI